MVNMLTQALMVMLVIGLLLALKISIKLELIQLRTTALTQTKLPVLTRTAPPKETLHGPLSLHQELETQLKLWMNHTQDTLSTEIDEKEF